jgi:magnesium chelatase family protein
MEEYCSLNPREERMMKQAFSEMNMTARTYYKVLGVARTIADISGAEKIESVHLREALCYRMLDKKYWGGELL